MGHCRPACRAAVVHRRDEALKRAIDVVGAAVLALLTAPLIASAAIAIVACDGGPPWFRQIRVGQHGRRFVLYKLRTMGVDAERRKAALWPRNEVRGTAFKIRDDPRVTWVGRVLRRTSLDELPQLVNVLRGEMSLVGPRPSLPCEVAAHSARERGRLVVKPGLTGLWQVSGRAALPFERWLELDLEYVARRSVALDLWLLLRTVPAVLSGRGAW